MHQAYYMAGYINISFNSVEEHIVNVNIMNLNRGTQVRELVDTSVMSIVIDMNQILSAGDYTIELVYDNDNTYVGYFTLYKLRYEQDDLLPVIEYKYYILTNTNY